LLSPSTFVNGVPWFDFQQVAAARSLCRLLEAGASPRRLFRSLSRLGSTTESGALSRRLTSLMVSSGRLVSRTDDGRLTEGNGQFVFDFAEENEPAVETISPRTEGDRLFEEALRHEQASRWQEAARCYRRLMLVEGPNADVSFNLANVLTALNQIPAAIERLHEAVMLDSEFVDAWSNLGNLLAEQNQMDEAREAYQNAVDLAPADANARFGLADVLEELGRFDEARLHWKQFTKLSPAGPQADYARERLKADLRYGRSPDRAMTD
jgi:tetratricopeptide (TPR) repeat protein